jgi:predicted metalloprotease
MLWKKGRQSENIEDRRGLGGSGTGIKLSGGMLLVVLLLGLAFGQDPLTLLALLSQQNPSAELASPASPENAAADDEEARFVSVILADTEDTWSGLLPSLGLRYQVPKLVLFTDQVTSACGLTSSATGPFYCPGDRKVYIDLGFFRELNALGAPGDFAQAYVIGHEIGHHVQNLLGISGKVRNLQKQASAIDANSLSVLMELQADCYAGVWAHHANKQRHLLEPGDVEEGLNAAAAIGDDRLQQRAGRNVSPESFTHGTSQQRAYWLRKGLDSGDIAACDTFAALATR